jgi:transcriptional regulator GlxA family with amidase domain
MSEAKVRTVGILIFDDVEVLDFCGPFEVFSTARLAGKDGAEDRLFRVVTIAEEGRTIAARGGLHVVPNHAISDHPPLDILLVPGGFGTRQVLENERLLAWIGEQGRRAELATSVCTGAFLLAATGLLDGRRATTYWSAVEELGRRYPAVTPVGDARFVDEGRIVTSAGVSAGIDMSLHVVARLHGEAAADWTARLMEYERRVPAGAG